MKNGKKLKLGDDHVTPRHIQEVQPSKLGDAQGIPFFINKNIKSCFGTLYFLLLHMQCVVLGASLFLFLVQFSLLQYLVRSQLFCFGEKHALFSLPRTLQFHSYYSASVLFLLALPLVFVFVQNFLVLLCSQVCSTLWSLMNIALVSCSK